MRAAVRLSALATLALGVAIFSGCDARPRHAAEAPASAPPPTQPTAPAQGQVPVYTYEIVRTYPHDRAAFTQGLIFLKGIFLESTGLNGSSSLRKVDPTTGRVLQLTRVPAQYFAEGMTVLGGKIYQLTWQSHKGFIYDLERFEKEAEFTYTGEGWGLTTDCTSLILSDGTHEIRFLDPKTFKVTRSIAVFHDGQPLRNLNELEFVHGEIFANIWQTNTVARLDPATGRLLGLIDFSGLLAPADYTGNTDVLNGIAHDATGDRLFVTGKNWPKLFEVRLKPRP